MQISVFDLFKIGIGPSSSHTVGPMKAARLFARQIETDDKTAAVARVKAELFGSLGATGRGHGSPKAVMLGLEGETPDGIAVDSIAARVAAIREAESLNLLGRKRVAFVERRDLILHKRKSLPKHPNGMIFTAFAADGEIVSQAAYYSIGGGFVIGEEGETEPAPDAPCPFPFASAAELLARCDESGLPMSGVMLANESARAPKADIRAGLLKIWAVMQECVDNGCARDGELPGGLKVKRRAAALHRQLRGEKQSGGGYGDPLQVMDWVNLFALAVNEENAGGGRVVTAPTNGAAGIAPAVLHYYRRFVPGADDDGVARFLLTAGAIGALYKQNASISGAEVGCQGEVGSACSMAAGGLAEVLGGTPRQVENAAEIAMEHNLGLTCDPIGGLVQIPCIERNAVASVKAINAARMALRGDGSHYVSLDKVIKTMRETGRDMMSKYKETARGGLATNALEVPVNFVDC